MCQDNSKRMIGVIVDKDGEDGFVQLYVHCYNALLYRIKAQDSETRLYELPYSQSLLFCSLLTSEL